MNRRTFVSLLPAAMLALAANHSQAIGRWDLKPLRRMPFAIGAVPLGDEEAEVEPEASPVPPKPAAAERTPASIRALFDFGPLPRLPVDITEIAAFGATALGLYAVLDRLIVRRVAEGKITRPGPRSSQRR